MHKRALQVHQQVSAHCLILKGHLHPMFCCCPGPPGWQPSLACLPAWLAACSPPVRCFRCALDRYMVLAALIEAGGSVVYGILVAVESGMISAAANYHGLNLYSAPCPQSPPSARDAPCRPEYNSRYTKGGSGRRRCACAQQSMLQQHTSSPHAALRSAAHACNAGSLV